MKNLIGLILIGIVVIELCALLEGTDFINWNFVSPTLVGLIK